MEVCILLYSESLLNCFNDCERVETDFLADSLMEYKFNFSLSFELLKLPTKTPKRTGKYFHMMMLQIFCHCKLDFVFTPQARIL